MICALLVPDSERVEARGLHHDGTFTFWLVCFGEILLEEPEMTWESLSVVVNRARP